MRARTASTAARVQFVRVLSGAVGRSLEANGIVEELREARVRVEALSRQDPVTGILNRRSIVEVAGREVLRSRRYHAALSLLQVRIDGFTDVNRDLGATQADEILRSVARLLAQTLREVDSVGRFGSATFLAVLPCTDEPGANVAIERIRSKISTIPGFPSAVTPRYGLRTVRSTDTLDEVLAELDRALGASAR
jgi:diguanylate cyclase (GGDEF)-like protein